MTAEEDDILLFEEPLEQDHPDNVRTLPMPWEQRVDEGDRAYRAFVLFRDMHPHDRQINQAARLAGVSISTGKKWAHLYEWPARVLMWDDFASRNQEGARRKSIEAMFVRHRQVSATGVAIFGKQLEAIGADIKSGASPFKHLDLKQGMALFRMCSKIEKEAAQVAAVMRRAYYNPEEDT